MGVSPPGFKRKFSAFPPYSLEWWFRRAARSDVGLIVPHGIRHWIGADHRIVLPMSILVGGGFLLACDLIARALFPVLGTDAPVGVVTSLVGGPVFLWMLMGEKGGNHGS